MEQESQENQVDSTSPASSTEEKKDDVVAYSSFRKSVEAEKAARKRAQELEAKLESLERKQLEEKGDLKGIVESYKDKINSLENELSTTKKQYLYNTVTSAIKTEAVKNGCVSPDDFIKTLDREDFETLQSDDGKLRNESIFTLIEKTKKEKPYFFKRGEVKFNDATPTSNAPASKGLDDMSKEEIEKKLRELEG